MEKKSKRKKHDKKTAGKIGSSEDFRPFEEPSPKDAEPSDEESRGSEITPLTLDEVREWVEEHRGCKIIPLTLNVAEGMLEDFLIFDTMSKIEE